MDISPKIKIITVATSEQGYLKWLKESCKKNGTELIVLGMGMKWGGYVMKFQLMNEFLKSQNDKDIVCFIDAYDVLMLKNVEDLKRDFISFTEKHNSKIICALDADINIGFDPVDDLIQKLINKEFSVYENEIRINSGTYIGYVKDLKTMNNKIEKISKENDEVDDQKLLNIFYSSNQNLISIDSNSEFFKVISSTKTDEYNGNPYFLHRTGNGLMINIIEKLGYKISNKEKVDLIFDSLEFLGKKIPYHFGKLLESLENNKI